MYTYDSSDFIVLLLLTELLETNDLSSYSMKHILNNSVSGMKDCNGNSTNTDGQEIKCGRLSMVRKIGKHIRKVPVFVRVYKTGLEHYAVLYRDQTYGLSTGYMNLKNCSVENSQDNNAQLKVTLKDSEGIVLSFDANSTLEASDWIDALRPQTSSSSMTTNSLLLPVLAPKIPKSPSMPTLQESDEDEWASSPDINWKCFGQETSTSIERRENSYVTVRNGERNIYLFN